VHQEGAQHPSMHWSHAMSMPGLGAVPASVVGQENVPSGGTSHITPPSPPELEPELLPLLLPELLPELEPESSPPELEPLELPVSSPASAPLLLPDPEFEDEEQAFVPMVPMPPIANRHTQKASFFMSHQSPRLGGHRLGAASFQPVFMARDGAAQSNHQTTELSSHGQMRHAQGHVFFRAMIFVSHLRVLRGVSEVRGRDPDAMVSGGHDPAPDPARSE
jgi:hypothetical protein